MILPTSEELAHTGRSFDELKKLGVVHASPPKCQFFRLFVHLRKIICFLLFFSNSHLSLYSQDFLCDYFDGFAYFYNALLKEDTKFISSEQNLHERLIFVQNTYDILLDFLNTADDVSFYEQLKFSRPLLDKMTQQNEKIFHDEYQNRFSDRRTYIHNGIPTYIYYNLFSKQKILNEEERRILYEEEMNRHKHVKLLSKQILDAEGLKNLITGQTYNFVLNLQNKAIISYDQRYKLKNNEDKTILNSPKHTFLAGNEPVLSAGVINFYKVGHKELFFLSCSSGHFHPLPDCLEHMKAYLISLDVPAEAIICLALSYEKIDSLIKSNFPKN